MTSLLNFMAMFWWYGKSNSIRLMQLVTKQWIDFPKKVLKARKRTVHQSTSTVRGQFKVSLLTDISTKQRVTKHMPQLLNPPEIRPDRNVVVFAPQHWFDADPKRSLAAKGTMLLPWSSRRRYNLICFSSLVCLISTHLADWCIIAARKTWLMTILRVSATPRIFLLLLTCHSLILFLMLRGTGSTLVNRPSSCCAKQMLWVSENHNCEKVQLLWFSILQLLMSVMCDSSSKFSRMSCCNTRNDEPLLW